MKNPPLILVADDDADFKEILSAKLLSVGYQVAEANDGGQAIAKAKSLVPDLIIMDIQMPNVNGTEAVLELKHTPETKDVKIIFFSSLIYPWPGVKADNPEFAQELGAITFLRKSDEMEKIVATVQGLLGGTPPAAKAATPPVAQQIPVSQPVPAPAQPAPAAPPPQAPVAEPQPAAASAPAPAPEIPPAPAAAAPPPASEAVPAPVVVQQPAPTATNPQPAAPGQ